MPREIVRTDPPDEHRFPQYASAASACKVGCFDCGAQLAEALVRPTGRTAGRGAHAVRCASCGMLKEFDLTPLARGSR
jgi:hypothetical protein